MIIKFHRMFPLSLHFRVDSDLLDRQTNRLCEIKIPIMHMQSQCNCKNCKEDIAKKV